MDNDTKAFVESLVNGVRHDLQTGFSQVNDRLDQTNARLDQTNIRLDASIKMTRDFRKDVSKRLDNIGTYMLTHDSTLLKHEIRLESLEDRVDDLEGTG